MTFSEGACDPWQALMVPLCRSGPPRPWRRSAAEAFRSSLRFGRVRWPGRCSSCASLLDPWAAPFPITTVSGSACGPRGQAARDMDRDRHHPPGAAPIANSGNQAAARRRLRSSPATRHMNSLQMAGSAYWAPQPGPLSIFAASSNLTILRGCLGGGISVAPGPQDDSADLQAGDATVRLVPAFI